ncbi:glutamine amidotransferase-like class 1 domain-containing protein 3, mitochondrial [Lepeophtheirus salmonis]|uniref:glutamine amidotransferase-like class 1 domain-containing protein 3, mitochondrial n=1 Tax=Lepeophtheirus salmonis TaxID=72036 RepID=UPI001AE73555|nr:glutamine amidotransferase-like class 1 domain-containing protein 3A, mitochondrial [Lepeophtheirus salmonis]
MFYHLRLGVSSVTSVLRCSLSTMSTGKIGVVLSGSGVYDGSEIHEASATLVALTRAGKTPVVYSLDKDQAHVIDHSKGIPIEGQTRNVLVESSRIARAAPLDLKSLELGDVDALIFPGGFGAAKNLSDFAFNGDKLTLDPVVESKIKDFHSNGKPLAFCCIAPILAAKTIPGVSITLGKRGAGWPHEGSLDAANSLGANVVEKEVTEVCVDEKNKVVSSPAFMYDGKFHEVHDSVTNMVNELVKLL